MYLPLYSSFSSYIFSSIFFFSLREVSSYLARTIQNLAIPVKFERDSGQSPACSLQWYLVKRNREERWRHRAAGESLQRTSENQARVYQSRVPISTRSLSYLPTFDIRGPPYGSDAFSSLDFRLKLTRGPVCSEPSLHLSRFLPLRV